VLSGMGLCDELITRPEESYRLWCVVVCDLGTSRMRRPWPALGRSATAKIKNILDLLWLLYVRTAKQPRITDVAFCLTRLGSPKLKVIYHIPVEKVLKMSVNLSPNNKKMYR
jgi:hypothetical protein